MRGTLALFSTLLLLASGSAALPPQSPAATERVVVVLADQVAEPEPAARHLARHHGATLGFVYRHALKGFSAEVPASRLDALARDPRVAYVEPDHVFRTFGQTLPTGVDRTEADQNPHGAIDGVDTRVDVDIAIIDTGIDYTHPDLYVTRATDCTTSVFFPHCTGSGNLIDENGHGTHVAGIAAALDNQIGVVGVAPGARLWSVKVLDANGSGFLSWVIAGIDAVTQYASEIEVANMSLGCECSSSALDDAITRSVAAGVVYVVAAGNSAKDASTFSPANHPDVITVSALADFDGRAGGTGLPTCRDDQDDTLADFSNYGPLVELAAPGVCITSTWLNDTYHTISGTSMASPHVAGAAGLYLAVSGLQVSDRAGVQGIRDTLVGSGLPQDHACGYTNERAAQGSTEPLLFVNATALGGTGSCDTAVGDPAPTVSITDPADGATVTGVVTFAAAASEGVSRVEFLVGDVTVGTDEEGADGWSVDWDSTTVEDGGHTVTAVATDSGGRTAQHSVEVIVDNAGPVNQPPTAAFTHHCTELDCMFDASGSSDPDGEIDSYAWDFGDGSTGAGVMAGHAYQAAGTYTVTLTVTDDRGAADSTTQAITVEGSEEAPAATMHVADLDGEAYKLPRNRWAAAVAITIVDVGGGPVGGAQVSGVFVRQNGSTVSVGCTTLEGSGVCFVESGELLPRDASVTFTVLSVTHPDFTYDPESNTDPDGDSDGTSIIITRP